MNPMKWKTKNVFLAIISILGFYILFVYKKTHKVMYEATIRNSNPAHVWEYVTDFSNVKKLNPTIEDFEIIEESGTYDHWKYSVQYTEHLSHFPMIKNTARGHYAIRPDNSGYLITSRHRTCFFSNFGCLDSFSKFRFDKDGTNDTKCIETVQYECPLAFSFICYNEVMYQREEIMKRLKEKFSVINNKPN